MSEVVVVGAGVIGLSAALVLSESGYDVKVVAEHFPDDSSPNYTSPWAGAHFRPQPSLSEKDFHDALLTRVTTEYFKKLAVEEPESSVRFVEGIDWLDKKGDYSLKAKGYADGLEDLKEITEGLPEGVEFGASYKTWTLHSPLYLQYLYRRLQVRQGVKFNRATLFSLKQVAETYPGAIIVNASGKGLQYQGGYDPECFLIRGQTLLVRPPNANHQYLNKTITHQAADGAWTFVIARPLDGGVILGGTKQFNDLQSTPKPEDTAKIIKNGKKYFPDLFNKNGEVDILKINVGFRPARKGGIRVEKETIHGIKIVHAYGAGGMGYELSYGVAKKVLQLLNKSKL